MQVNIPYMGCSIDLCKPARLSTQLLSRPARWLAEIKSRFLAWEISPNRFISCIEGRLDPHMACICHFGQCDLTSFDISLLGKNSENMAGSGRNRAHDAMGHSDLSSTLRDVLPLKWSSSQCEEVQIRSTVFNGHVLHLYHLSLQCV